jgi:hypothetical protein
MVRIFMGVTVVKRQKKEGKIKETKISERKGFLSSPTHASSIQTKDTTTVALLQISSLSRLL